MTLADAHLVSGSIDVLFKLLVPLLIVHYAWTHRRRK